MHDNADYDQSTLDRLVVENRILGLQLRRVAERCERLEQELLLQRVQSAVLMRSAMRAHEIVRARDEEGVG